MPGPISNILEEMFGKNADQLMGLQSGSKPVYAPMAEAPPTPDFFGNAPGWDLAPDKALAGTMGPWDSMKPADQATYLKGAKGPRGNPEQAFAMQNWSGLSPGLKNVALSEWGKKPPPTAPVAGGQPAGPTNAKPSGPPPYPAGAVSTNDKRHWDTFHNPNASEEERRVAEEHLRRRNLLPR